MVNDILKAYIVDVPKHWLDFAFKNISNYDSFDTWFNNAITWIDCTKVSKEGMRYQQTISYAYNKELSEIFYCIEHTDNIDKDYYYQRILDQHKINIEYEKENPPIIYGNRKTKKAVKERLSSQKIKQSKLEFDTDKVSAAERKLKAKAEKLNKLSITIKPA